MASETPIKNLAHERIVFTARVFVAALLLLAVGGVLGGRLYYLQVIQRKYYDTRSNDNRMRVLPVAPVRGLIYGRHGVVLADNVASYRLDVVPEQVHHINAMLKRLGKIIPLPAEKIQDFKGRVKSSARFDPVPLIYDLTPPQVARFEVNRQDFPGVDIHAGLSRNYPQGKVASHVVGYVGGITARDLQRVDPTLYRGSSHIGKSGVERAYERVLHGKPGSKIVEANAEGRTLRQLRSDPSSPGQNLYLTLDVHLQQVAERALGDNSGAVVAIAPDTGDILTLASKPSFNPQPFVNGISQAQYHALVHDPGNPLFDRAIRGQYPPGSTVKPFMAVAGLGTDGGKNVHERFCPGTYRLPHVSYVWHGWKRWGHGHVNLHKAIVQSCDIYFYDLAHDLGIQDIDHWLSRFGFGHPTGVDLPGEQSGVLPSQKWKLAHLGKPWYPGDTLNAGIGQGYWLVTPLQLAQAVATLARRGHGMKPHIVYAFQNPMTGQRQIVKPKPLPPINLPAQDWQRVINAMQDVIQSPHGTAHRIAKGLTYTMAGKTGTAQVRGNSRDEGDTPINDKNIPKKYRNQALFIAFAPVDHPQIAIAVIVEHGGEGGAVAAPIARKVADAFFAEHSTDRHTASR